MNVANNPTGAGTEPASKLVEAMQTCLRSRKNLVLCEAASLRSWEASNQNCIKVTKKQVPVEPAFLVMARSFLHDFPWL